MLLSTQMTPLENIMQLVGLIIVFVLILVAATYTTKWVGKTSLGLGRNKNISVVETYKISQFKFIQIIRVGEKYIAVGISKDHIEYLTEVDKDQLIIQEMNETGTTEFKDIFSKLITKQKLNNRK